MKITQQTLCFQTPAFLGNARQEAQWRSPPIKALLRQWWRVAYAAHHKFEPKALQAMRHHEGLLFGHAWLDDDTVQRGGRAEKVAGRRSALRLRLDRWVPGSVKVADLPQLAKVSHPEVKSQVGSDTYLGFGPLKNTTHAVIRETESAQLSLAVPEAGWPLVAQALGWMSHYGTLGGRSRNGWGSFSLSPQEVAPAPLRPWREALQLDWPHALGQDDAGALIWQTPPRGDWRAVMQDLARLKIGLRTQFKFPELLSDGRVHARHWLSYPVTHHEVSVWKKNKLRLPNSLRFKVRPLPTHEGSLPQWVGVVFHMPCLPPPAFQPDLAQIQLVWQQVHRHLDAQAPNTLTRIPD